MMNLDDTRFDEEEGGGLLQLVLPSNAADITDKLEKKLGALGIDTDSLPCGASPEEALVMFVNRLISIDPLVQNLYRYCRGSSTVIQISDPWYDVNYKELRYLALTSQGMRVYCTAKKDIQSSIRRTEIDGFQISEVTDCLICHNSFNEMHARALLNANKGKASAAERILEYLAAALLRITDTKPDSKPKDRDRPLDRE